MWQYTQINPSNYTIIERFDVILDMANSMKSCHVYYVSLDGNLYGCPEEGYAFHALTIPGEFRPSVPFVFRMDSFTKEDREQIAALKSVVYYYDSIIWAVFPLSELANAHMYHQELVDNIWEIVDANGNIIPRFELYKPDSEKAVFLGRLNSLLSGYANIQCALDEPIMFIDAHEHNTVQEVANNKVAAGRRFLILETDNRKKYGLFIFRNLFNLNKGDSMDIIVRDRKDNFRLFQAEFIVKRKKNPLKGILDKYELHIFTQYLHLY